MNKMTKSIAVLLLTVGVLFGTTVGMMASEIGGPSAVRRNGPAIATVPAATGAAGIASLCVCTCGFTCSGSCNGYAPTSCGAIGGQACIITCCDRAPYPDPGCGPVSPIIADGGDTADTNYVDG
jgi:hypothetical protein